MAQAPEGSIDSLQLNTRVLPFEQAVAAVYQGIYRSNNTVSPLLLLIFPQNWELLVRCLSFGKYPECQSLNGADAFDLHCHSGIIASNSTVSLKFGNY
jgi:hypothetical protein